MMTFFAAVLPVIILFCGLTIDVGLIELRKIQMQTAADAAAVGAELEVERGTGAAQAVAMGKGDAAQNGFTDGSNTVAVTLTQQPTTGPYAGNFDAIQATITQQVKTIFMGTLNGGSVTVSAQAVSLIPPCIYFTGTGSLSYWSLNAASSNMTATCPVYINTRFTVDGFSQLYGPAINVAGSSGASSITGATSPAPRFNALTMADPLATIAAPSFGGGCTYPNGYKLTGGNAALQPGTYCQGMTLINSTVSLAPGLYVITGGADWSGSTVTGSGVTLFFTQGGGGGFGTFRIEKHSNVSLSAPTTGPQATILVFADRAWVKTGPTDFQLDTSTFTGDGVWYLTGAGIIVSQMGNVRGSNYFGIVADNTYFYASNIAPSSNFSAIPTGNPFRPLGGLVQ